MGWRHVWAVGLVLGTAACTGHDARPPAAAERPTPTTPTTVGRHVAAELVSHRNGIAIHAEILDRSPDLAWSHARLVRASRLEVSQGRPPVPARCFLADTIQGTARVGDVSHPLGASRPRRATGSLSSVSPQQWLLPGKKTLLFVTTASVFDPAIVSVRYVLDGTVRDQARPARGWVVLATVLRGKEALPPWWARGSLQGVSRTGQVIATVSVPHDDGARWC